MTKGSGYASPAIVGDRLILFHRVGGKEVVGLRRVAPTPPNPGSGAVGMHDVQGHEGLPAAQVPAGDPKLLSACLDCRHVEHAALVSALDRHGKRFELDLKDFPARVVQHETDHLDGVLFIDRLSRLKRTMVLKKLEKLRKAA